MIDDWWRYAACKGADLAIFFEPPSGPESYKLAREYCAQCPVISECLEYAIATDTTHGMFGGMTRQERRIEALKRGLITKPYNDCGEKKGTTAGYHRERELGIDHCGPCLAAYNKASNLRGRRMRERKARAEHTG